MELPTMLLAIATPVIIFDLDIFKLSNQQLNIINEIKYLHSWNVPMEIKE